MHRVTSFRNGGLIMEAELHSGSGWITRKEGGRLGKRVKNQKERGW